eukprot:15351966-Ditylum_brightwellii.AAC.1
MDKSNNDALIFKWNSNLLLVADTTKLSKNRLCISTGNNVAVTSSKYWYPMPNEALAKPNTKGDQTMDFESTSDPLGPEEKEGEIQSGTTKNQNGFPSFLLVEQPDSEEDGVDQILLDVPGTVQTSETTSVTEINDKFLPIMIDKERYLSMVEIDGYHRKERRLQLKYLLTTDETQWVNFQYAKVDHLLQMAQYRVDHYTPQSGNKGKDWTCSWVKKTLRVLSWAICCITKLYDFYLDEDGRVRKVRRVIKAKKKKNNGHSSLVFKYSIEVPQSANHAIKLDGKNGDMMWQDIMALEAKALNEIEV